MDHPAVDVALGSNVDGVDLDDFGARSVGWDSEDLDFFIADVWFACEPIVESGEDGSCGFHVEIAMQSQRS